MLRDISLTDQKNPFADISRSELGESLAKLQRELVDQPKNVLILIEGWESSGKGLVLNDIVRELDPRYYEVYQFLNPSDEEKAHPFLWRFFRRMPAYGHITIFNHSYYSDVFNQPDLSSTTLKRHLHDIAFFEKLLIDDGTCVIKIFLHQSKETMQERIEKLQRSEDRDFLVGPEDLHQLKHYERYFNHFEDLIEKTGSALAPWLMVSTEHRKEASRLILGTIIERLEAHLNKPPGGPIPPLAPLQTHPLQKIDLKQTIDQADYDDQLRPLQEEAGMLLYALYKKKIPAIIVFEGTDAAGKGGTIKRLTRLMDPRGFEIATTAAPDCYENRYHYLWRFYREFPAKGTLTIFDRSWYGRVVVERIEKFTPDYRWKAAYEEIKNMEKSLAHEGCLLLKFLLVIDKEEQKKRFDARANDPDKAYKLTDEDWRNHEKFDLNVEAMDEMVERTSTTYAPWVIVPSEDKNYARIKVLETFIDAAKARLKD